jgi:hypothetical protein
VNKQNGDIISGCADGKVRVFTVDQNRKANENEINEFNS